MSDASTPKAIRKRLNWSQGQMADYLGLNRSSVSRMEKKGTVKGSVRRLLDALPEHPQGDALPTTQPEVVA